MLSLCLSLENSFISICDIRFNGFSTERFFMLQFFSFVLVNPFIILTLNIIFCNLLDFLWAGFSGESFFLVLSDFSLPVKVYLFIVVDGLRVSFLKFAFKNSVRKLIFFKFQQFGYLFLEPKAVEVDVLTDEPMLELLRVLET